MLNILPGDKIGGEVFEDINTELKSLGRVGAFGDLVFEVSSERVFTFDDYQRDSKARYAKHDLVNEVPALEFLGRDLEEVSFTMKFSRRLGVNPRRCAEELRRMCHEGEAKFLVINCKLIGENRWVIESFSEMGKAFDGWGRLLFSEVKVKLKEYREKL